MGRDGLASFDLLQGGAEGVQSFAGGLDADIQGFHLNIMHRGVGCVKPYAKKTP